MFTESEMESRHSAVRKLLHTDSLNALLLIGDTNIGPDFYGDMRYLTNHRVIFYRQAVVILPDSKPVLFLGSNGAQKVEAASRSSVRDCRVSGNLKADVTELLKERGAVAGKIGVSFEMLPTAWHVHLKQALPQVEWVDVHEHFQKIRFQRSQEETNIFRKGAALADGSFEAIIKFIRPGVSEFEIVAEIERHTRAQGVEENFTLITSGRFALGDGNRLPGIHAPSPRRIEMGDTIEFEITPRYQGYWTQLARMVNVGRRNDALTEIHTESRDAIKSGLEQLKPGRQVADVFSAIESHVTRCGYKLTPGAGVGHLCGVDLVEARVNGNNEMVLTPGTAVIIHPRVFSPDGKSNSFCGETYLVTQDGYERINKVGDELLTV